MDFISVVSKIIFAAGVLFLITNLKNLPFIWHIRCFNGIIKHFYRAPHDWKKDLRGPAAIFQPIITASYAPLLECDFNGHKSSSTYLTDLDVSRLHLIPCLFNEGIKTLGRRSIIGPNGEKVNGRFAFVLGGIECNYRREIKLYEKYEIWTRVLAWDLKWIYIVSHFVKKGAIKPQGYTLSNGKWFGKASMERDIEPSQKAMVNEAPAHNNDRAKSGKTASLPNKAIYASAISKYVFKKGRLTLHPEIILEASGLLPPRPGGWATTAGPAPAVSTSELPRVGDKDTQWTWQMVEAENAVGLKLGENFAALDGLFDVFTGSKRPALGVYSDLVI